MLTLEDLDHDTRSVVNRLAERVVRRGMSAPAILFLESVRPMNFIASQAMVFFAPMVGVLIDRRDYDRIAELLEHRESIELLVTAIEAKDDQKSKG